MSFYETQINNPFQSIMIKGGISAKWWNPYSYKEDYNWIKYWPDLQ